MKKTLLTLLLIASLFPARAQLFGPESLGGALWGGLIERDANIAFFVPLINVAMCCHDFLQQPPLKPWGFPWRL